jgi:hypothetical protein
LWILADFRMFFKIFSVHRDNRRGAFHGPLTVAQRRRLET